MPAQFARRIAWNTAKSYGKCTSRLQYASSCDKSSGSHSEELWEMHKGTIEAARRKTRHKKLWTVQIGTGPKCPALLDKDF